MNGWEVDGLMFPACIYCGDSERPRTDEHVLQEGFGTNLKLSEDVCGECNAAFSPLDGWLLTFVRVYLCWDHPDVHPDHTPLQEDLGLFFCADYDLWLTTRIDHNNAPIIMPQLVVTGDNDVRFIDGATAVHDVEALARTVRAELREPQRLSLKVDIRPDLHPPLRPTIIRTGRRKYLLRVSDETTARELRSVVDSGRFLSDWQPVGTMAGTTVNPEIQSRLTWRYGGIARAVAKAAMNFACVTLGAQLIRNPAFDTLRRFILKSEGSDHQQFVHFLFGDDEVPAYMATLTNAIGRPGQHALLLSVQDGVPFVIIVLYQRPFAAVRLTEAPHTDLFRPGTNILGHFNYRTKKYRILSAHEHPSELAEVLDSFLRLRPSGYSGAIG